MALASEFGIAEGTARVALSRMVDNGELLNDGGEYQLCGALLRRQHRQDSSRERREIRWDGTWDQAVVVGGAADASRRNARRSSLRALKLAELREGVWMRPANLDPLRLPDEMAWRADEVLWASMSPSGSAFELVTRLWDLQAWGDKSMELIAAMGQATSWLGDGDDIALAPGFELAAAVLRHLVADPDLPKPLLSAAWPGYELRSAYDAFDTTYRDALQRFLAAHR